ncbi:hypothetical protein MM239_12345 [Belliella sp. DSM 111904]|uniref:Uncharacterized protein n=1 Tax=Belliella filtrata TaxID=2923435 RepID=A0ABS9V195_9BACT|nr:hypothetical protein [Belliella filtrata]MCH7410189.1 hypothetical protein [Belliella filtrata]
MKVERVNIGIPEKLKSKISWIDREYRLNILSFEPGGTDIVVEFTNGEVRGYDWVKYPGKYFKRIFEREYLSGKEIKDELAFFKTIVYRIFARKFKSENYNSEPFTEIWNSKNDNILPYNLLDSFTSEIYNNYKTIFLNNIDLAIQYISIHYPFDYSYLIENWELLEHGSAHYSVFISDIESVFYSSFGLSYNKNIRWNSKLRAKYNYGFRNLYIGRVEGTGFDPVEYDEQDYLDIIIPLDFEKEIQIRNYTSFLYWSEVTTRNLKSKDFLQFSESDRVSDECFTKKYDCLQFSEFKEIFENNRFTFLVNDSIWENTLKNIIDIDFCNTLLEVKKAK